MILTFEQIQKTVQDYFKDKPVKKVFLFGSYAKGNATDESDVDLLIEYDESEKKASLFDVIKFKLGLEEKLDKQVELVEEHLVYHRFLPNIQSNKTKIYEA